MDQQSDQRLYTFKVIPCIKAAILDQSMVKLHRMTHKHRKRMVKTKGYKTMTQIQTVSWDLVHGVIYPGNL